MSFLNFYKSETSTKDPSYFDLFSSRPEIIESLRKKNSCDVLVVGGGIHGATFARLAAFNGLNTVLLEKNDYAWATSSRSSKMAHGGLRYLELFDFPQVFEGIKAREDLFRTAPHLVKPHDFFIPVPVGDSWFRRKMSIGLFLYDLFLKEKSRKHRWSPLKNLNQELQNIFVNRFDGGFIYCDGIMNDTRLVIENIVAARQEGARCLNHASVNSFAESIGGRLRAGWTDLLTNEKYEIEAGIVVNCAGPWVPYVGRLTPSELSQKIAYSQGTHLLFKKAWSGPALFMPMEGKARYYFVWPHRGGTLVGTTERILPTLSEDPKPTKEEINEILSRLEHDLPGVGLDKSSLFYAFSGVRTLPLKGKGKDPSLLSRRHIWHYSAGMLSLIGGKFTTASWTAVDGLKQVFSLAGLSRKVISLKGKNLPGGALYQSSIDEFRKVAAEIGIPQHIFEGAISRLGSRVRFLLQRKDQLECIGDKFLRGEIEIAHRVDQGETVEDLMERRFEFQYEHDYGLFTLDAVKSYLENIYPDGSPAKQADTYTADINKIKEMVSLKGGR